LGARIIEKHFTLNKSFSSFRDHQLSADPTDMRELVLRIQNLSVTTGKYEKKIQSCEKENINAIRRSIVASADLPAGHIISSTDLTWIRPGGGMPPGTEHKLIGKKLKNGKRFGESLKMEDIE
jgi:sialic acid synthase SpsE